MTPLEISLVGHGQVKTNKFSKVAEEDNLTMY